MPIWLRNYTFNTILEHYSKTNELSEAGENNTSSANKSKEILRPNISPSYTTKASK